MVVPGKSGESELVERLTSNEENFRMPPEGARLPAEKVARRVANAVERDQRSVYVSWIPDRLALATNYVAGWAVSSVLARWARRAEA